MMELSCIADNQPGSRSYDDLVCTIPWFRKYGKNILKDAPDEILIKILQKCQHQRFQKDSVIILQGDIGDRFFILLEGQISVYVRDTEYSIEESKKKRASLHGNDLRNLFGTCVLIETEGYSFGEYALLDERGLRRASVIADSNCEIISIDMDTYDNSLKDLQQSILLEREQFINKHNLFKGFSINVKELIKMSLKKVQISYNTNLITQGEPFSGLMFIISGSGHLSIDASKHETQYPDLFPLDFTIYDQRYKEFPELKPLLPTADRTEEECVEDLNPKVIRLKRAKNYPALEKYIVGHNKHIVSVQPGEIIGDYELLFDLHTNLYSITCFEETEVYVLENIHIKRLFNRVDQKLVLDRLKYVIGPKLAYREKYFRSIPVPLLLFLRRKMYDKKFESIKEFPKMRTEKHLPSNEEEWQHLLQLYVKNKAPNFLPYTKNSVFLKDLMKWNASRRERLKGQQLAVEDLGIQFKGTQTVNFPIDQSYIYKLQKIAKDSVNFIELVFQEVNKQRRKPPKLRIPVASRSVTQISVKQTSFLTNRDSDKLNIALVDREMSSRIGIHQNEHKKSKLTTKADHSKEKESLTKLQKSEIQFLNTLCSEKSRYEIKRDNPIQANSEGIRVHFLPSLPDTAEVLQRNFRKRELLQSKR